MTATARDWLDRIRKLPLDGPVKIMNVCGGHERSISAAGIRGVLPAQIELVPGPGCPVCICPEEDVYEAIHLALEEDVTLVTFGDMLRVPVNVTRRDVRSLEQAKAAGADIRPIASPTEAIGIARDNPERDVVFFAAGFETTMAPVAASFCEGPPDNLYLLLSGRLTWPAVEMLLASGEPGFDALIAPGHVSTVMGPEDWDFVVDEYGLPAAVAGFTSVSLLAAMYSVLRQYVEGKRFLDNCYPEVVRPGGNPGARRQIDQVFDVSDATWRGIGTIPASGYRLKPAYAGRDSRQRFGEHGGAERKRAGLMPKGCDCAKVVLGKIYPNQCQIYGLACTPRSPIGPCMVSEEGACRIWWAHGIRERDVA